MDSIKSALPERHRGCGYLNHSAAYNGDGWTESNHSSGRHNCTARRQHSILGNRRVVDSYGRSNGHVQSECFYTKRYVDARDWQWPGCAAMDYLQSTLSIFTSGRDHPDRHPAYDNLPNESGRC